VSATEESLFAALDATWPAARVSRASPWTIREGAGGGQRVSAATANGEVLEKDIDRGEAAMRAVGQRPLFMIRRDNAVLDGWLDARGYEVVDPVAIYSAKSTALAHAVKPTTIFPAWPPLAIQTEIWAAGGVGEPRLAVMTRAAVTKTALLERQGDRAVATSFVACNDRIAMLHALEVIPEARRCGAGTTMMAAAANWAVSQNAEMLVVMVTRDNAPANALYRSLGMAEVGQYHYRRTLTVEK
jgi:GNAT superfamily N-acetyltransferase